MSKINDEKLLFENSNISRAQKVLDEIAKNANLLLNLAEDLEVVKVYDDGSISTLFRVQAYSNGREQGYHLSCALLNSGSAFGLNSLGFSFSENRNSDSVVVYTNANLPKELFDMGGNIPSEIIYKEGKHFFNSEKEAAEFIIQATKDVLEEVQKIKKLEFVEAL